MCVCEREKVQRPLVFTIWKAEKGSQGPTKRISTGFCHTLIIRAIFFPPTWFRRDVLWSCGLVKGDYRNHQCTYCISIEYKRKYELVQLNFSIE